MPNPATDPMPPREPVPRSVQAWPVPIEKLKDGDVIVGPFGRYEFRVERIFQYWIEGVYTKVLDNGMGYALGSPATYLFADYDRIGGFIHAR